MMLVSPPTTSVPRSSKTKKIRILNKMKVHKQLKSKKHWSKAGSTRPDFVSGGRMQAHWPRNTTRTQSIIKIKFKFCTNQTTRQRTREDNIQSV